MTSSPEMWAFILANTGLVLFSSLLMGLSYLAYKRSGGRSSYRVATIGFGFVVLGGLVDPVYQVRVGGDYVITVREFLLIQTAESVLIAIGLGVLFFAVTRHGRRSMRAADEYEYEYESMQFLEE